MPQSGDGAAGNGRSQNFWRGLVLEGIEQTALINTFKGYDQADEPLKGDALLEQIRDDVFLPQFSRLEIIANYEIYKRIFNFLKAHDVDIVKDSWTSNSYFKRVLATLWPAEELNERRSQCYELLLAFKRGEVHLSPRQTPPILGTQVNPFTTETAQEQQDPASSNAVLSAPDVTPALPAPGSSAAPPMAPVMPLPEDPNSGYHPLAPTAAAATLAAGHAAQLASSQNQIADLQAQVAQLIARSPPNSHEQREYALRMAAEDKTDRANAMAARYRSVKSRFSGKSDPGDRTQQPELWKVALAKYQRHCSELDLDNQEKVSLIHNMFTGDAETFYYSNLDGIKNWGTLIESLNERYNSYAHQRGVLDTLRNLHIADFTTDDCDTASALLQVAHQIEVLVPQAPKGHQSDQDKLEHLHRAVLGTEWSRAPISNLATTPRTYKQFYDELKTAEQSHRLERKIAAQKFGRTKARVLTREALGPSSTFFTGQARYGRDPKARQVAKIDDSEDDRCFNCGDPNHRHSKCPKPRDDERIARERVKWAARRGKTIGEAFRTVKKAYLNLAAHVNYLNCANGPDCFGDDDLDDAIDRMDDSTAEAYHLLADRSAEHAATAPSTGEHASLSNALDSDEGF